MTGIGKGQTEGEIWQPCSRHPVSRLVRADEHCSTSDSTAASFN